MEVRIYFDQLLNQRNEIIYVGSTYRNPNEKNFEPRLGLKNQRNFGKP